MRHTTWGFKYFLHLPYDIHSLILSFLHPEDIIATRKTCKAMFDATLQRDLWMKAVVQLCQENAVHPSSFPVARMSLLALEYASMGVMRWKRLVSDTGSSGKKGLLSPFREMSLRHDFLSSAELFLVPGGRFLLILNAGRLSIWDLLDIHEPTACPGDIQPIASIDCHSFTSHPAPEGSGILIITITINNVSETDLLYEVFKIFPGEPKPRLVSIARISILSEHFLRATSVVGNRLVMLNGRFVKIWDFVTNAWACWDTGYSSFELLLDTNTIALIGGTEVHLWDFPELSLSGNANAEFRKLPESAPHIPPRAIFALPDEHVPDLSRLFGCGGLCDWYTGSRQPLMFDTWEQVPRSTFFEFTRFRIDSLPVIHPDSESCLEVVSTTVTPAKLTFIDSYRLYSGNRRICPTYRACGDDAVMVWNDDENVFCHTGASGLSPHSRVNSVTTALLDIKNTAGSREFSLCPISGRLCYLDCLGIRVVDFFPPPRT